MFYISLLKPYWRRDSIEPPPPNKIDGELKWNIKNILDQRWRQKKREFLVYQEGYFQVYNSWELKKLLQLKYNTAIKTFLKTKNKDLVMIPNIL